MNAVSQYSITVCQSNADALIATDRNEWAHLNLSLVNDGYLHNFEPPTLPCGLNNPTLVSAEITISLNEFNINAPCVGVPIFGNVLLNCPLTTTAVCPIVQDVLTPGCGFGIGSNVLGSYSLDPFTCGTVIDINDVIGVDIIPATENLGSCPNNDSAIQDGVIEVIYEICINYTFDQDLPDICDNTISLPCDDNDPCTDNDVIIVDECDNNIVCTPCVGELQVNCIDTEVIDCDDGDPCTLNDVQTVSVCDNNFVCIPCEGELTVDCNNTVVIPCDDGNECTENDVLLVSACDDSFICEPCQGIPVDDCSNIIELPCDDGNPCTENDVLILDLCSDSTICIPCTGDFISPLNCDDQNCNNGFEVWDDDLCICITIEPILGCTDPNACNYDPIATCEFECDYSCIDCAGVAYGNAMIDDCGNCLDPEDPLLNFSCLGSIYVPNSFTPNGDGKNDYFEIFTSLDLETFNIRIFNRIGQNIYSSNDPAFKWNGTGESGDYFNPTDIYIYTIDYTKNNGDAFTLRGHLTLIR